MRVVDVWWMCVCVACHIWVYGIEHRGCQMKLYNHARTCKSTYIHTYC